MGGGMDGMGMGGMGGMGGMDSMGGMGGMGGMAGFGGIGDMGMVGMYGNRMAGMGEIDNFANNAYERDNLRSNGGYLNEVNPYFARGFGEELRGPMGPMAPMVDESAVGRDKVPLGYEDREVPYFRRYHRHRYFDNDEDFDDEGFDDDDDQPYLVPTHEHAAFEEPFEEGPESEMDDGYDAPYDRKTKIAKIGKLNKKEKIKHRSHRTGKGNKGQPTVASKKHVTEKRGKTSGKQHQRNH